MSVPAARPDSRRAEGSRPPDGARPDGSRPDGSRPDGARDGGSRRASYPGFNATLKLVGTGPRGSRDLSFDESREALRALLAAEATPAQAGAFLIATRIKGESPEELAGYAQALRDVARPLTADTRRPLVACAGAYDGSVEAPHLSLAAAVLAAACGAGVVVHCGPRLGPKYGVTARDVLAELGGPGSPTLEESEAMLSRAGVTLVDTARAVAGWDALLTLRNEVGLRGPVHSAEKLLDYFGARRFVVGYTHSAYAGRLLGALHRLGAERAITVRGIEGSDVVRPGRPVAHELAGAKESTGESGPCAAIELPEQLGQAVSAPGGERASAELTTAILAGAHHGPELSAVLLGAAIRLYAAGLARDARDAFDVADAAIKDGNARATLAAMVGR
ncbi:MAG: anthranilate phosphoribosyltransferase [Solirubrobacteraceae bacterium]